MAKETYREKQENELEVLKVSNPKKLCRHQ